LEADWSHDAYLIFVDAENFNRQAVRRIDWPVESPVLERIGLFGADFTRLEVLRRLTEVMISDSAGSCEIFGSVEPLEPESQVILDEDHDPVVSPNYESWLFMVDWEYLAEWEHDAYLFFIDVEDLDRFAVHHVRWWVTSPAMGPLGMFGHYLSREETGAYLRETELRDSTGHYELWASRAALRPADRVILANRDTVETQWWIASWLFMVDWNYEANWSHPAHLYFQNIDEIGPGAHVEVDGPVASPEMERLGVFGENFTREEAFVYLTRTILADSTDYQVKASRIPVEAGSDIVLRFSGPEDTLQAPNYRSWLFFADWNYRLDGWPHEAHLYFLDADSLARYDHQTVGLPVWQPAMDDMGIVSVKEERPSTLSPNLLELRGIFPNPFNGLVTIDYSTAKPDRILISIFDADGREIERPFAGEVGQGRQRCLWQANKLPSGAYLVRVESSSGFVSRRVELVR